MTRAEHLEWAKARALEYVDQGDLPEAYASLVSDFQKHEELRDHVALSFGFQLLFNGYLRSEAKMREFITGFR